MILTLGESRVVEESLVCFLAKLLPCNDSYLALGSMMLTPIEFGDNDGKS